MLHTSVYCGLDDVLHYMLHVTTFEVSFAPPFSQCRNTKVFDTKDADGRDVLELAMLMRMPKVREL